MYLKKKVVVICLSCICLGRPHRRHTLQTCGNLWLSAGTYSLWDAAVDQSENSLAAYNYTADFPANENKIHQT